MCCSVPGRLSVYDTKTKRWLKGGDDGIPAGITPIHPDIDPKLNRVYHHEPSTRASSPW